MRADGYGARRPPADTPPGVARLFRRDVSAPGSLAVVACTLLPDDPRFDLGHTLAQASGAVALNHPHCARFCVLGGSACSR